MQSRSRARSRVPAAEPVRAPASPAPVRPASAPPLAGVRRAPAPAPPNLLDRARLLGHRPEAISRQLAAAPAPPSIAADAPAAALQRVKILDKKTKTGRRSKIGRKVRLSGQPFNDLFNRIAYEMYTARLAPRGSKGQLKEFLRGDESFDSEQQMIGEFLNQARRESERVVAKRLKYRKLRAEYKRKGKKWDRGRVQSWTRPLTLGRPTWTKEHKAMSKPGQDIRHIVRNATLKAPLEAEFNHYKDEKKREEAFVTISNLLGLPTEDLHPWQMLKAAYNKLFLHKGNLFGGSSAVNRVIGLSADVLREKGREISDRTGEPGEKDVDEVLGIITSKVKEQAEINRRAAGKFSLSTNLEFLRSLDKLEESIQIYVAGLRKAWLEKLKNKELTFWIMGFPVAEVGDNFGFDMIVSEGSGNVDNAQQRQQILIQVERELSLYEPGDPKRLGAIFLEFLKA